MSNFFSKIPPAVRHGIVFGIATLILLYALGILSAQLQIIIVILALLVMLKSFTALGGMTKIAQLLGSKSKGSSKKSGKDNEDDIF